jgi:hypothetical protein
MTVTTFHPFKKLERQSRSHSNGKGHEKIIYLF